LCFLQWEKFFKKGTLSMKKIIFLLSMLHLPTLIAMEKEKEHANKTTSTINREIAHAFDNDVKCAIDRLKPIPLTNQVRPHIVDIFPLPGTDSYLKKKFGEMSIISQILLPDKNQRSSIQFNHSVIDAVISLGGLHRLNNKHKKGLFDEIAKNLIQGGQLVLCLSAKPNKHHPSVQAFNKLKENVNFNYLSHYKLKNGYHYITPKKAKKYIDRAGGLTTLEITPYTRTIRFENTALFTAWLLSWLPSLSAFKQLAGDQQVYAIKAFATQYLKDNPPHLDGSVSYSYPHLLVGAQKE
jgi:hypothetical protein